MDGPFTVTAISTEKIDGEHVRKAAYAILGKIRERSVRPRHRKLSECCYQDGRRARGGREQA